MVLTVCNFLLRGEFMYQVLYRKWRPQVFDDVVGQPQVTITLKNELKNNRINHAYLFTGSRGTGKTTCAKILSKAVNCLNPKDGDPCGECENCKGIDEGNILDVVEMDAASNRGIGDIKNIIEEAQFRPARGKYRVYIIDEVHMLTTEAFNALLKTLEEPPEHVIFILATTEVHKLPTTILSRCQRFDFHRIAPENMTYRLKYVAQQENATITDEAAMLISAIADGAMRDALSLMDRCLGITSEIDTKTVRTTAGLAQKDYLFQLAACCINKNTAKALDIVGTLHNDSKDMARLCDELLEHFRNLMLIKSTNNPHSLMVMSNDEFDEAQTQSDYLSLAEIVYMMDVLQNAYQRMGKGNSDRVELEMALVKLSAPELESNYDALVSRVSALEKAIKVGFSQSTTSKDTTPATKEVKQKTETEVALSKIEVKTEVYDEPPLPQEPPIPSAPSVVQEEKEIPKSDNQVQQNVDINSIYLNATPFRQWPEVVANIKQYSKAIAAAFDNTNAYESGNYLLIEADSEIPFRLLKESSQRDKIRTAIQEITGKVYKLGPYKKPQTETKKADPLQDLIQNLKDDGNINFTEE